MIFFSIGILFEGNFHGGYVIPLSNLLPPNLNKNKRTITVAMLIVTRGVQKLKMSDLIANLKLAIV